VDGTEWNDRAGAYRGTLLTGCRKSYSHAVRMASEKLSSRRFSQKRVQQPARQDGLLGF
jgi:hypothetical protein